MASITFSLTLRSVRMTKATPDQKTAPSACFQVKPKDPTTKKATYAFNSMPGANAKGNLVQSPITIVAKAEATIVAKSTKLLFMPACERMAGLTTKMEAKDRKVDNPAKTS